MKIEYTTPDTSTMKVAVSSPSPDGETTSVVAPEFALCVYTPEPFKGIRDIPVGKFKAIGDSGRVEEATVVFDLRKGEFVIKPKQLVSTGFDFDKPVVTATPATPAPAVTPVPAVGRVGTTIPTPATTTPPTTRPHRQ